MNMFARFFALLLTIFMGFNSASTPFHLNYINGSVMYAGPLKEQPVRWVIAYTPDKTNMKITNIYMFVKVDDVFNGKKIKYCESMDAGGSSIWWTVRAIGVDSYFKKGSGSTIYDYEINSKHDKGAAIIKSGQSVSKVYGGDTFQIYFNPNFILPPGTCILVVSSESHWKCYFEDGSTSLFKVYLQDRLDLKEDMTFHDPNKFAGVYLKTCVSGTIGKGCEGNSVVQYTANADGSVTKKTIKTCSSDQTCQNGECVWKEGWTGKYRCKDQSTVEAEWRNSDGSTEWRFYKSCSSDQVCQNGKCVWQEGYTTEPYCKDEKTVVRKYRHSDGSIEEVTIDVCGYDEICESGQCVPKPSEEVSPPPTTETAPPTTTEAGTPPTEEELVQPTGEEGITVLTPTSPPPTTPSPAPAPVSGGGGAAPPTQPTPQPSPAPTPSPKASIIAGVIGAALLGVALGLSVLT